MEVIISCMECQVQSGFPNFSSHSMMRLPDDGVIEATCPQGHQTFTIIQDVKFELLSDMAVKAIVDGYYRDAIASFTAALERLYEFYVEAACRKNGIGPDVFRLSWKSLAKQSERQLGAFIAAFLIETGSPPKLLPRPRTELRNEVIHKGKFPSRQEAIDFGQAVAECASPILEILRSDPFAEIVQKLVGERLRDRQKRAKDANARASTCSISTTFSLTRSELELDIERAVAAYALRPDMAQVVRDAHEIGAKIDFIRQNSEASCISK
ncbi:hypothetical protein [Novosphingobium jiangmenense]|uniref:RiboL-PSP-HEPN domain-containing protein n=1 Tax=Novosphingobium jiangmenense TaxID=2791981 RepID=A0ABS0HJG8_9SPHN|nr:hypothetical protein [Novosphingobium jiangmenense]MBF9152396.1 hypothetical protein [Novosphingobium jiangmenense]